MKNNEIKVKSMKIEFRRPTLADRQWMDEKYRGANCRICEGSFVNMYLWGRDYGEIGQVGDFLVQFIKLNGVKYYAYPAGTGDLRELMKALADDAKAYDHPLRILTVTSCRKGDLETVCPGKFSFESNRNAYDYLYKIERLTELKGKKLQAKRNHINRFIDANPDWTTEELSSENLDEVKMMTEKWYAQYDGDTSDEHDFRVESEVLKVALEEFEVLGFTGVLLRSEGEIVAFSMGNPITPDTFDVNFEKAYGHIQGAYALINREMARHVQGKYPEIVYLNREDDMGLPGLRRAKESYYPDILLEKSIATLVQDL